MADNFDDAIIKLRQDKLNANVEQTEEEHEDFNSKLLELRKVKQTPSSLLLRPAGQEEPSGEPSIADVAIPAFFHGASIGAYKPDNYKKLVEARPWTAGIADFAGAAIPITLLSMIAGPVVGLGARGMLGVGAATRTANIATAAVTGSSMGAMYGGAEAYFEGKPAGEVAKQAVKTGAIFGALEPVIVGAGMAYKAYKGIKFDKKLADVMGKQVEDVRGDLINDFKKAAQNGDEAGMSKIRQEFDKYPNLNAGGIPNGTIIELPQSISNQALARQEPRIKTSAQIFSENLFNIKDKPALGEFKPIRVNTTTVEIKSQLEEGAKEFTKRRNEVFDVLFDVDNKKLLDATTDLETKIPYRHVKFRVTNGEVKTEGLGKIKPSDRFAIQDGLNELKNNYFNSDIYGTVYKKLMEENLSLDVNGAIKSLKEQSIADQIAGKKLITIKEITNSAKSKGLLYEQKLNNTGAFEFNLKAENGDEIFFPTIDSTNHFLSNYKKGMFIVDRNKLVEGSYQYVIDNAPELVANLPKQLNETLLKQEAEKLGIKFDGIQRGLHGEEIPLFTDLKTKSTFAIREGETLTEAIARKRKEFGITGHEVPNIPGEKTPTIRTGIEIPLKPKPKTLPEAQLTAQEIIENSVMKDGEALPPYSGKVLEELERNGYILENDIGILNYIKPFSYALEYIETKTKIPAYTKIYKPLEHALKQKGDWIHPQYREIEHIWSGVKKQRQDTIGEALEVQGLIRYDKNYKQTIEQIKTNPELKNKFGDLTEKEFNSLISTRKKFDEYFSFFGVKAETYLEDYLPRMRAEKLNFTKETLEKLNMPKEYNVFFRHQRQGNLQPREKNPVKLLKSYSNIGATEKFIMPEYKKSVELFNSLTKNKKMPKTVADITKMYIEDVRGWQTGTGQALQQSVRTMLHSINKIGKTVGWQGMDEDTIETLAKNFISYELSLTYSGAMGFRSYTTIRNAFQPVVTVLPMVGSKYFLLGLKDALTKEGWRAAKSAGHLIEDYSPVPFGEELIGKGLTSLTQTSLYGVRKSDSFSRVVAYNAALRKATHYGDMLTKDIRGMMKRGASPAEITKRKKKFINQAEIDWLSNVIQEKELAPLIDAGRMKEVAELYAKHMVEKTQFIYRKANGPVWARGDLGRLFGQFGTWPTWYIQLARSMMKGSPVNITKRAVRFSVVGALTTIVGTEVFGVDIHKWVWHHPLMWGGPPSAGVLSATTTMMGDSSEYDKAKASKIIQNYGEIHIPGYMALKDLYKASQEDDEENIIKRALGFKPVEEE